MSPWHRLLFEGLWLIADREGRLLDKPARIKAAVLPYDDHRGISIALVDQMLTDLDRAGFIRRYAFLHAPKAEDTPQASPGLDHGTAPGAARGTTTYQTEAAIQVLTFTTHQNPHHREPASLIPPYSCESPSLAAAAPRLSLSPAPEEAGPSRAVFDTVFDTVPDPVLDPVYGETSSPADAFGAAAPPPPQDDDPPERNLSVITRIVHDVINVNGMLPFDALVESVKIFCATKHVAYDSATVNRAIDSALHQRRQP